MMRTANLILTGTMLAATAAAADSKTCAGCHAAIYRSYSATPMARTSGPVDAATAPLNGRTEFVDTATAIRFRILQKSTAPKQYATVLRFAQAGEEGERRLDYFVGAGVLGRSYASSLDGFLFQAPVSHYTSTGEWDLSPGFEGSERLPLTRPLEPACLNCHATGLRILSNTVNGYENPPFTEAGVSCERCHGPGETHIARMKSGDNKHGSGIVNPAKLNAATRDSICAQCHLVGAIRVAKTGGQYEPGNRLFDSTSAFLWSNGTRALTSNSHFEQLITSACWKNSGGKLWCGSCHSPHAVIPEASRPDFYRQRCRGCHGSTARECSAPPDRRAVARDSCIGCHMTSKPILTVAHSVQVDHTIPRVPAADREAGAAATLVPFPGSSADDRELGLAYATEAIPRNNRVLGERAFQLLKKVAADHPEDGPVAVQLAQLYDRMGQEQQACDYFEQAVKDGAPGAAALVNLGACRAKRGDIQDAMKRWAEALSRNPASDAARLNLAVAQIQSGDVEGARNNLRTALQYDPFFQRARDLLRSIAPK